MSARALACVCGLRAHTHEAYLENHRATTNPNPDPDPDPTLRITGRTHIQTEMIVLVPYLSMVAAAKSQIRWDQSLCSSAVMSEGGDELVGTKILLI